MDQVSTCILCRPVKWVLPFVGNHLSIGIHPFRKWLVLLISFPRNPCRIGHMSWAEKCLTPCGPMYTTISRFVDHLGICGDYLVFDSPSFIAIFQCIFIATWYPMWCEMLVSDYVMMCNKLWVYFARLALSSLMTFQSYYQLLTEVLVSREHCLWTRCRIEARGS